ncbi:NCS2 family permease [Amedibacillus dolichus]|uniref:NCS2 family permease n=1 Tax=Amedibacillus dolichus TaxID=31971 RepID=UPI001D0299DB|nr:NCS2 family permease [Amedibacillus dolichus]MCB5374060.1 NCS2 family permease [Amedibacillus dolichus]
MLEKLFKLNAKNTSVKTEIIAGITTFLAMAYILGVNPGILGDAGMDPQAVFMATAISAAIASIVMGLLANYPVALAPGMGVNALFSYTVVMKMGFSWQAALAAVFVSGVVFLLISVTGIRKMIINAIPKQLKLAVGAGIGFFIAFVGLKNAGIIVTNASTAVGLGSFQSPVVLLAVFGILVTIFLVIKKVPAAVFVGMIITAAVGIVAHEAFGVSVLDANGLELMPALPTSFISTNFEMSAMGSFMDGMGELFAVPGAAFVAIFSFLFVDFFDTAGTLVAIGNRIGLVNDKGELENAEKALVADAVGTVVGAALGTSTVTSFVESSSGVGVGGRTGLTAVTAGVLFLLSIFISPIVLSTAVSAVTAPALVVVGIMMAQQLKGIDWDDMVFAAAGFITVVFMILSYSISNGIAMGFIAYTVAMVAAGKVKQINLIVWALVIIFILYFGWLI